MNIPFADSPPAGWSVLDVMRTTSRKWDWTALMIDVDPEDLKNCACKFPALFYVHPKEYRPGQRTARHAGFAFLASTGMQMQRGPPSRN